MAAAADDEAAGAGEVVEGMGKVVGVGREICR